MANSICLECKRPFKNDAGLHIHLKSHSLSMEDYYQKHFPRYDRFDGTLIKYEDRTQYFTAEFNSPANFKSWLKNRPPVDEVQTYIRNILTRRKDEKKLVWAPMQVELKSLDLPGIKYLTEVFGSYYKWAETLGFKVRYVRHKFDKPLKNISKNYIVVDTREQLPLTFTLKTISKGLGFGDYKLNSDHVSGRVYIERKSIADFCGTLGGEFDRFRREVMRAYEDGAYLAVVVEGSLSGVEEFTSRSWFKKPIRMQGESTMSPDYIFHNMRELIKDFPNLQFVFVKDRAESSRVIEKIFACNSEFKEVDLQLAYDLGNL